MSERRTRKKASARKAEIVETAIRLSADIGPDRVTTQHLADAVGVTQPAIFRHFATKNDIWIAVGEHIADEMAKIHSHPIEFGNSDPHDVLNRLVGHHFVHIANNPAIPAIMFSRELQADNTPLRERFSALRAQRIDTIAALIRRAQEAGQHHARVAAEDSANLLIAAIQGISMRWLVEGRRFDLADEGGRVLGSLLDGFRA